MEICGSGQIEIASHAVKYCTSKLYKKQTCIGIFLCIVIYKFKAGMFKTFDSVVSQMCISRSEELGELAHLADASATFQVSSVEYKHLNAVKEKYIIDFKLTTWTA